MGEEKASAGFGMPTKYIKIVTNATFESHGATRDGSGQSRASKGSRDSHRSSLVGKRRLSFQVVLNTDDWEAVAAPASETTIYAWLPEDDFKIVLKHGDRYDAIVSAWMQKTFTERETSTKP